MILNRLTGELLHTQFTELAEYLRPGDLLVLNDSRVLRARLWATKDFGGTEVEMLLFEEGRVNEWWALLRPGKRVRPGTRLTLLDLFGRKTSFRANILRKNSDGHYLLEFSGMPDVKEQLGFLGEIPLPPYINRRPHLIPVNDYERYQTVYADRLGSVAAPTAGLHFTEKLLSEVQIRGVSVEHVTLHVGLGTFAPLKTESLEHHIMHEEKFELSSTAADAVSKTQEAGGRVVAVGTTTLRVLETVAGANGGRIRPMSGATRIFIYPPFGFQVVDALITNFHLPRSTLLMLVSAFAAPNEIRGRDTILGAYAKAIQARYRFFSYGDAMLIV